jgi:hypothetical protein
MVLFLIYLTIGFGLITIKGMLLMCFVIMKKVLFFILVWHNFSAQYSIEWSKGIRIYSQFTNWINMEIDSSENLYLATKGQNFWSPGYKSMLFKISGSGDILFRDSVDQINAFQLYKKNLYSLAYGLTKRTLDMSFISKENLIWYDTYSYCGETGVILRKSLYTTPSFSVILKYDSDGTQKWIKSIANTNSTSVTNYVIQASQDHIFLFCAFNGQEQGARVIKYDTLGNEIWKAPCGSAENMKTDSAGNVYLINWNNITKINSEGQMEWSKSVDSIHFKNCAVYDDTLYACGGVIYDPSQPNPNWDFRKAAYCKMSVQNGHIYSTYRYRIFPGTSYSEAFTQIAKTRNALYFAGTRSDNQSVVLHFVTKLSNQSPAGIQKNAPNPNLLNIFPNPTGRAFTLSYKGQAQELKIEVKNALGQSVYGRILYPVSDSFSEDIDLGQQSKGVYFVEVSGNGIVERRKIVVE